MSEVDGSQTWAIRPLSHTTFGAAQDYPLGPPGRQQFSYEVSSTSSREDHESDRDTLRPLQRNRSAHPDERRLAYKPSFTKSKFQWMRGELLGKGSYGKVYLALNATTGEIMAVKQVELPKTASEKASSQQMDVMRALKFESDTLSDLDHPNIVSYLGFEESADYLSIFLEYVPGGTISALLHEHGRLREEVTTSFLYQILRGLEYLHSKSIIHRDLKADNILVTPTGVCKISDFGISKKASSLQQGGRAHTMMRGTVYWMAPEVVSSDGGGYDVKVDIWAIGCVALEMWSGTRPWGDLAMMPVMFKLVTEKLPPPVPEDVHLSELAEDFRLLCFQVDPQKRPHAKALKKHRYLQSHKDWLFDITDVADTHKPLRLPPIQYAPDSREAKSRTNNQRSKGSTSRKDRTAHVEPKASRAAPKPPLLALKIPEYKPPRSAPRAVPKLQLETTQSSSQPRSGQKTSGRHIASPGATNEVGAPRVVYITPPGSPRSRANEDGTTSAAALPSASDGNLSSSRRNKSRRLVVINPDAESNHPSFVYTPPPLPLSTGSSSSSTVSPKHAPPRWRDLDIPAHSSLTPPATISPPPSSSISSAGADPSPVPSSASARSPRPLPPSPAAPIPMPSTSLSFKSAYPVPSSRYPLSAGTSSTSASSSRHDHHDISNTAYRAAHIQRHPSASSSLNGKSVTSLSIRRLPISPPLRQLKTSTSTAHLPPSGHRSLIKQQSVPDVSIFSFGRSASTPGVSGAGAPSPIIHNSRSFSVDESDLEFDDLDTTMSAEAPPSATPSSAASTVASQSNARVPPEPQARWAVGSVPRERTPRPVGFDSGSIGKGRAEQRMTLRPKPEDVYQHLESYFRHHDLEQTVDDGGGPPTPIARSLQNMSSIPGDTSSFKRRNPENRKSIKMIAKEHSRWDPAASTRTRLWNSEVRELKGRNVSSSTPI